MIKRHDSQLSRGRSSNRTGTQLPTGQFRDKNPDDQEQNLTANQEGSAQTLVAVDSPDDFPESGYRS